jgi:N-methylhydantoinase A
MPISKAKAHAAVTSHVAEPLDLTTVEAAWGILTVLATNVTMAMRTITIERGYDPREFTLVPFGGMGPTISGRFVTELGIGRTLVPRDPGTFSAFGMLVTDVHQTRRFTRITRLDSTTPEELEDIFAAMEKSALADLLEEKFARDRLTTLRSAGMRYRGQSYEVDVPVTSLKDAADLAVLGRRFHEAHRRRYGHMAESEAIEIVNFQVTAIGQIPKPHFAEMAADKPKHPPTPCEMRAAYFSPTAAMDVPVYSRTALGPGMLIDGPAVIEEKTSTIVLYPGQRGRIDGYLNLEIEPAEK